jgi:hypothetical protein
MKLTVLATAAAAALALVGASTAEAGPRYSGGGSYGGGGYAGSYRGGHSSGHGYVAPRYTPSHCAPVVYKTHTVEVNRYTQCRTAYDHCGRPYTYHVTVVTYCDHYSNGTSRTWSRTFS